MIAYLKGILVEVDLDYIIVDVNGIGYKVFIHSRAFHSLPVVGNNIFIYTYFQITENEQKLFGFINKDELNLFEKIISVSGMGTKAGINILSSMEPSTFCQAIISQDEKSLTTIPGIGKKSAARLIFELKDKLADFVVENPSTSDFNISELVEAMEVLGYHNQEIRPIINRLIEQGKLATDTGHNVKLVLKEINIKNV